MLPRKVAAVRFEVITPYGVAYRGTSTRDLGSWNSGYQAVYQLSFTGLRLPGQYQVKLLSPAVAVSPEFIIGDGTQLYRQLVDNAVQYFTSERDGPDVDSAVLNRQPANLTDEKAYVYAGPKYDGNDDLLGGWRRSPGPSTSRRVVDAGGGYEKSRSPPARRRAHAGRRAGLSSGSYDILQPEATFGLQWITKLWNPAHKVLTRRSGSATATRPTRSRATTTSGSCRSRRTG